MIGSCAVAFFAEHIHPRKSSDLRIIFPVKSIVIIQSAVFFQFRATVELIRIGLLQQRLVADPGHLEPEGIKGLFLGERAGVMFYSELVEEYMLLAFVAHVYVEIAVFADGLKRGRQYL